MSRATPWIDRIARAPGVPVSTNLRSTPGSSLSTGATVKRSIFGAPAAGAAGAGAAGAAGAAAWAAPARRFTDATALRLLLVSVDRTSALGEILSLLRIVYDP